MTDQRWKITHHDGRWWIGVDARDERPVYRFHHMDRPFIHEDTQALVDYGPLSREVEVDASCPVCALAEPTDTH